jgi:HAD superfamily phosphatase
MKGILFDMDGVLVDVSGSYRLAVKKTVEFFIHQKITLSQIQEYKNRGGFNNDWDLTQEILKECGVSKKRDVLMEVFQNNYLGDNFDGLIKNEKWMLKENILEKISEKFKLGIVTGRPHKEAFYAMERFAMKSYFPVLIAMEDVPVHRAKPDPLGILMALKKLEIKEAFYVGDTVDDMRAASRANTIPVGVINDSENIEKQTELLIKHGAQWVLRDINDLEEVIQ